VEGVLNRHWDQIVATDLRWYRQLGEWLMDESDRTQSFVRTIKEGCLEQMIFFGEDALRNAIREFVAHYHFERLLYCTPRSTSSVLVFITTTNALRSKRP
jgi:hypothetical protein